MLRNNADDNILLNYASTITIKRFHFTGRSKLNSNSNFWSGVSWTPQQGRYCIYYKSASGASNRLWNASVYDTDGDFVTHSNRRFNSTDNQVTESLTRYYQLPISNTQDDNVIVMTKYPPNITTDGLLLNFDATMVMSYPRGGDIWTSLDSFYYSSTPLTATAYNSPIFELDTSYGPNSDNTCFQLDGNNEYFETRVNTNVQRTGTSPFTFECLVKPTTKTDVVYRGIVSTTVYQGGGYVLLYSNEGPSSEQDLRIYAERWQSTIDNNFQTAYFDFPRTSFYEQWVHLCVTYTGTTLSLYIQGDLKHSVTSAAEIPSSNTKGFNIGRWERPNTTTNLYFDGRIKFVRLYNRSLSSFEILDNYNVRLL